MNLPLGSSLLPNLFGSLVKQLPNAACAAVSKPLNCSWLNGFGAAEGQMNVPP